jgi:hypothetical protein
LFLYAKKPEQSTLAGRVCASRGGSYRLGAETFMLQCLRLTSVRISEYHVVTYSIFASVSPVDEDMFEIQTGGGGVNLPAAARHAYSLMTKENLNGSV